MVDKSVASVHARRRSSFDLRSRGANGCTGVCLHRRIQPAAVLRSIVIIGERGHEGALFVWVLDRDTKLDDAFAHTWTSIVAVHVDVDDVDLKAVNRFEQTQELAGPVR